MVATSQRFSCCKELLHTVVSGPSLEAFKQTQGDVPGMPALSYDAELEQKKTLVHMAGRRGLSGEV